MFNKFSSIANLFLAAIPMLAIGFAAVSQAAHWA
jgi:hypothetical protein